MSLGHSGLVIRAWSFGLGHSSFIRGFGFRHFFGILHLALEELGEPERNPNVECPSNSETRIPE
jgi:hypothetical protein